MPPRSASARSAPRAQQYRRLRQRLLSAEVDPNRRRRALSRLDQLFQPEERASREALRESVIRRPQIEAGTFQEGMEPSRPESIVTSGARAVGESAGHFIRGALGPEITRRIPVVGEALADPELTGPGERGLFERVGSGVLGLSGFILGAKGAGAVVSRVAPRLTAGLGRVMGRVGFGAARLAPRAARPAVQAIVSTAAREGTALASFGAAQRLPPGEESPLSAEALIHDFTTGAAFGTSGLAGRTAAAAVARRIPGRLGQVLGGGADVSTAWSTGYGLSRMGGGSNEDSVIEATAFALVHGALRHARRRAGEARTVPVEMDIDRAVREAQEAARQRGVNPDGPEFQRGVETARQQIQELLPRARQEVPGLRGAPETPPQRPGPTEVPTEQIGPGAPLSERMGALDAEVQRLGELAGSRSLRGQRTREDVLTERAGVLKRIGDLRNEIPVGAEIEVASRRFEVLEQTPDSTGLRVRDLRTGQDTELDPSVWRYAETTAAGRTEIQEAEPQSPETSVSRETVGTERAEAAGVEMRGAEPAAIDRLRRELEVVDREAEQALARFKESGYSNPQAEQAFNEANTRRQRLDEQIRTAEGEPTLEERARSVGAATRTEIEGERHRFRRAFNRMADSIPRAIRRLPQGDAVLRRLRRYTSKTLPEAIEDIQRMQREGRSGTGTARDLGSLLNTEIPQTQQIVLDMLQLRNIDLRRMGRESEIALRQTLRGTEAGRNLRQAAGQAIREFSRLGERARTQDPLVREAEWELHRAAELHDFLREGRAPRPQRLEAAMARRQALRAYRKILQAGHVAGLLSDPSFRRLKNRYLPQLTQEAIVRWKRSGGGARELRPIQPRLAGQARFRRRSRDLREMTIAERKALGVESNPGRLVAIGLTQESWAVAKRRLYEAWAQDSEISRPANEFQNAAEAAEAGFTDRPRVSASSAPEARARLRALGPLEGRWMRGPEADIINEIIADRGNLMRAYQGLHRLFRSNKTFRNPGTHARQWYANIFYFLNLAGHSPWRPRTWQLARRAVEEWRDQGPIYREMLDRGGLHVDQAVGENLAGVLRGMEPPKSAGDYSGRWVRRVIGGVQRLDRAAIASYRFADDIVRLMHYMSLRDPEFARQYGRENPWAVDAALQDVDLNFPNYSRTPRLLNRASRHVAFLKFPYEVARITGNHLWRPIEAGLDGRVPMRETIPVLKIAAMYAALQGLQSSMAQHYGLSEDEVEEIRRGNRGFEVLIPGGGRNGVPHTLDLTYIIPFMDIAAVEDEPLGLAGRAAEQLTLNPIRILFEPLFNRELGFGREIYDPETDPMGERVRRSMNHLWNQFAPTLAGHGMRTMFSTARGENDWQGFERSWGRTLSQYLLGLRVQPQNVPRLRRGRLGRERFRQRELESRLRSTQRRVSERRISDAEAERVREMLFQQLRER